MPSEIMDLKGAIQNARLPEHISLIVQKEMDRLLATDPALAEYAIGLNYIQCLISLPWNRFTNDNLDIQRAETILSAKHFGLTPVKERILDYLAVRTLCSTEAFFILVVEDEEIARTNLSYALSKAGYAVDTASNGQQALEKVREKEFDLVLTDLKMEKMDGIQLLESVKKNSPVTEVVLITGYATVDTAVDALKKGAVHYLSKPINLEDLRQLVSQIRAKKKYITMARGPVLCFAGPPGTGKTSIGKAIAEAMERKFVRISLAGMRDEAELRGHRRTYVGAMTGRIISEIRKAGVKNPVFMLDEIDKIGQDFRGDPASVLLEILDPEQNGNFTDNYLDAPFDLSGVMFITTANTPDRLPAPLLDRMEPIHFTGYSEKEKIQIAKQYIIPRQMKENGLAHQSPAFSESAVSLLIRDYTREAGVRQLEQKIAGVCRKLARLKLSDIGPLPPVEAHSIEQFLGPRLFPHEIAGVQNRVGVTTGLVWSEFGGEIIFVEATRMKGNQQLILTGSLGAILKESAQTALSYIRSHAEPFHIDPDFFQGIDIHIHIPAGAIPKDGPSAGITIGLALLSLLTGRPARRDAAMTGELTLSGRLLPVAGIREKLHAAQRAGIRKVILPRPNETHIRSFEPDVTEGLEIILAEDLPQVVEFVLE